MKRLVRSISKNLKTPSVLDENDHKWTKVNLDGFCECAGCGTRIEGNVRYEKYGEEAFCEDCYQKMKNK